MIWTAPDDGDFLTDLYHDYQLSPMGDMPNYDIEETRFDSFWLNMEKVKLSNDKV